MLAIFSLLAAVSLSAPPPIIAASTDYGLTVTQRGFVQHLSREILFSRLRLPGTVDASVEEQASYQLHLLGHYQYRFSPPLSLNLGIDTGLLELADEMDVFRIDAREPGEAVKHSFLLGETYLEYQMGNYGLVELRAGKLRPRIGAGAIFDAYALGAQIDVDLSLHPNLPPLHGRIHALWPDASISDRGKSSPLFHLSLGYRFNRRNQVHLLLATLIDGDSSMAPILENAISGGTLATLTQEIKDLAERNPTPLNLRRARNSYQALRNTFSDGFPDLQSTTEGQLWWAGITAELEAFDFQLELVGLLGFGELELITEPTESLREDLSAISDAFLPGLGQTVLNRRRGTIQLSSYLFQSILRYFVGPQVSLEAFLLTMSGDQGLGGNNRQPSYDAFVSLAPLLDHTSIFVNGGLASSLASPIASSMAPDGHGLFSGGLTIEVFWTPELRTRGRIAAMQALVPSVLNQASFYGFETNLLVDYAWGEHMVFFLDGALFSPGDYFGDLPPGFQTILGLQLHWGEN